MITTQILPLKTKSQIEIMNTENTTTESNEVGSNGLLALDDREDIEITVGQHKKTGKYHGLLYRNKPTPSGCDRWILQIEHNVGFDTAEEALAAFRQSLSENLKG